MATNHGGARTVQYVVTIFVLLTLNFFLPRMMPGDPLSYLLGDPGADAPILLTEEMRANLLEYYGLDKPLVAQYRDYVSALFRGDLGWSITFNAPVRSLILGRLKWTLFLGGAAAAIYIALGVALGAVSAWRRGSRADIGLLVTVFSLGSWPPFFLGMVFIVFFSFKWGLFPIGGAQSAAAARLGGLEQVCDVLYHGFLPILTLVLTYLPAIYLITRNSMLSVLGEDYVRTARSKGVLESLVLLRHALPNALLPIVTAVAMRFGFMIMGTMFVEVVFAYPGMGTLIYEAGAARDYPLLQGAFLVTMVFVLALNLLADALYGYLDPRVRRACA
ncbi:MAG: ABC transporter permease [Chloroflexota bacterium]|nr:ABC transporter permease [Chloroflexota bacterium]